MFCPAFHTEDWTVVVLEVRLDESGTTGPVDTILGQLTLDTV